MIRNINYFVQQLRCEMISYVLKIIQITVSFAILGTIIFGFEQNYLLNKQIKGVKQEKSIYVLADNNSVEYSYLITEDDSYVPQFQNVVKEILKQEDRLIVLNNVNSITIDGVEIELLQVTSNFFDYYNIEGELDKEHIQEEFKIHKTIGVPSGMKNVILGDGFRRYYKVGEQFVDNAGNEYKVMGFLNSRQYYAAPIQGKEMNSMEYSIVTPVYLDMTDSCSMFEFIYGCQFLVDDVSVLHSIQEENDKAKLLNTYFRNFDDQLEYIKTDCLNEVVLDGILGVALFVFSFMGMLCTLIQRIEDNSYEYAINLLCGAQLKDIYIRIVFEFIVLVLIGLIITYAMYGFSIASGAVTLIASVSLLSIILFAKKRIDFNNLIENMKSRD